MFEKASRMKLRFASVVGQLTVEDLWDLPLTTTSKNRASLDDVARAIHSQLKTSDNVSFVEPATTSEAQQTLQLQLEIVKHVIQVKQAENSAVATERARQQQKQKLMQILDAKQDQALQGLSVEELQAAIAAL